MKKLLLVTLVVATIALPLPAAAQRVRGLWDDDTLEKESRRRPAIAELVTGRARLRIRGTRAIEQARQQVDRPDAPAALFDDLARAYLDARRPDDAAFVMDEKRRRFGTTPETIALLASARAAGGDLEEAREMVHNALEVAPEDYDLLAHGVLIEQLSLIAKGVDYAVRRQGEPPPVRIMGPADPPGPVPDMADRFASVLRNGWHHDPLPWLWLGRALALGGDNYLALRALVQARRLGSPVAILDICEISKRFRQYCWGGPHYCKQAIDAVDREWKSAQGRLAAHSR